MSARKSRGLTQKLFLIETIDNSIFSIMGSTGNVYTVIIKDNPSCSCPDFATRHNRCKHIYFVLIRIMNVPDPESLTYSLDELKIMCQNAPIITENLCVSSEIKKKYDAVKGTSIKAEKNVKCMDDLCPICLDDLNNDEPCVHCKFSCGRAVHEICFKMWSKQRGNLCVYCQKQFNVASDYVNLIN
jgi:hypothetical protein